MPCGLRYRGTHVQSVAGRDPRVVERRVIAVADGCGHGRDVSVVAPSVRGVPEHPGAELVVELVGEELPRRCGHAARIGMPSRGRQRSLSVRKQITR
jgi:hypothetical protein